MKKAKKLLSAILFAFTLLLAAPVVLPGYSNTETVQAAVTQRTLVKGRSLKVKVTNASNLTWRSSDSSVATVSTNSAGTQIVITAKAKGTAYIQYRTANSSSYTSKYLINVATVNKSSIVRSKNGSYTLKLSGVPSNQSVKWSITDSSGNATSVAALSSATVSSVKVTAKAAGTAYVKATIGGLKQTVTKVKVETPSLSKTSIGLTKGNSYTLKVNNTTQKVTWSSSNTNVATVSSGKVTAKGAGSGYIYATVAGVRYRCKVTVKNPLTAADYMKNLKTKISKSSRVTSAGTPYICRGVKNSDGTSKYYYYIYYQKAQDRLKFVFKRKDTDSKRAATISMYIYSPSKSYKTTPSLSIVTNKGISFKSKRTFSDYRQYSNKTDYTYSITKHNVGSKYSTYKSSMVSLSNDYLQLAMTGWNTLLKKNGFTMKQIGFTAF